MKLTKSWVDKINHLDLDLASDEIDGKFHVSLPDVDGFELTYRVDTKWVSISDAAHAVDNVNVRELIRIATENDDMPEDILVTQAETSQDIWLCLLMPDGRQVGLDISDRSRGKR